MKRILDNSNAEVKNFFLRETSYYNFDLPKYFCFQNLIDKVEQEIGEKNLVDICGKFIKTDEVTGEKKTRSTYPCNYENVNYQFINNKDGKYAWRPLQLIHPAIYVSLVNKISEESNWKFIQERFKEFNINPRIKCLSIPLESEPELTEKETAIINWWQEIEQKSIELSLQYEFVLHSDIADCYGSIYTHSVAWALHTKEIAKKERDKKSLIGNIIDKHLQDMSFGQTNGIPQGSVLMDFIAEIVLGYADLELSNRIKASTILDYDILRYRDDYRIFTNNPQDAELILKFLTEILIELGLRINTQKMLLSNNIVQDSIKPDKLFWVISKKNKKKLQPQLLLINELANKYSNSGSLIKALIKFYRKIEPLEKTEENIKVLISIIVDITFKNPKTYPISSAILSKLLSFLLDDLEKEKIIDLIINKFAKIPNTGNLLIWLQRVTLKIKREKSYEEKLCEKLYNKEVQIWNSEWLSEKFQKIINDEIIINEIIIENMDDLIAMDEVESLGSYFGY